MALNGSTTVFANVNLTTGMNSVSLPNVPIGSQTFTATTYSAQNETGSVLSVGQASGSIAANATTNIPLTLNGIVASIVLSNPTAITSGTALSNGSVSVNGLDASGTTIIGTFVNAITLAASNGVTFGSALSAPGTATFSYDGTAIAAATVPVAATAPTTSTTATGSGAIPVNHAATPAPSPSPADILAADHIVMTDGSQPYVWTQFNGVITSFNAAVGEPSGHAGDPGIPRGVAVDASHNIYVANAGWYGGYITIFSSSGTLLSTIPGLNSPQGMALDNAGNIYVADQDPTHGDSIRVYSASGSLMSQFNSLALGLNYPMGLTVDNAGNIYVANAGAGNIKILNPGGGLSTIAGGTISTGLQTPNGVAVDGAGNIYVANYGKNNVAIFTPTGAVATSIAGGKIKSVNLPPFSTPTLSQPNAITFDPAGNIFVSNRGTWQITTYTSAGILLGTPFLADNPTGQPVGIAVY